MSALPSFVGIAEEFREPGQALIRPERFAAALNLQLQELAQLAHVHRSTVSEAPANARLQAFMRKCLQVICAALEVAPAPLDDSSLA
jgi:DNA-binding Xre family transcriptional regulator